MCLRFLHPKEEKSCDLCREMNPINAKFCRTCGGIFCQDRKCNKVNAIDSDYCERCGHNLHDYSINNGMLTYNQVLEELQKYGEYRNRGFLSFKRKKEKEQENEIKRSYIEKNLDFFLKLSNDRINQIIKKIKDADVYLTYSDKTSFLNEIQEINKSYTKIIKSGISNIIPTAREFSQDSQKALDEICNFNNKFIEIKILEYTHLFKNDGIELDDDQKTAVITDDKHNLVVAGAGSGKTEVLITRIAYLTQRKKDKIEPNRILALAFQKKAAEEIRDRLRKRYNIDGEIKTFHSLGNKILEDYAKENRKPIPKLKPECSDDWKYSKYIQEIFDDEISVNSGLKNEIINFMKFYGDNKIPKEEKDFDYNKEEFYKYQRSLRYTTLDGTKVKSESERKIMNYFLSHKLNGKNIRIVYEYPAPWMRYKKDDREIDPRPDFYFPDFGIYLEHWTIKDENENVPEWYPGNSNEERNRLYLESRAKKKEEYEKNNIILVETSGEELRGGNIDTILKEKFGSALRKSNPKQEYLLEEMPYNELVEKVWKECKEFVKYLPKNIARFIVIAKTYRLYPDDIERRLSAGRWSPRQKYFGSIALKIYERYQNELSEEYIDFQDMINKAADILIENPTFYQNKYDHILIDEYQDISTQRYELIKQLMRKNPNTKLFCVGDDWQSIMGFAGSNLDYFINFENYFDHPARTDLTKNYRSIKTIVDVGACIIDNNKGRQIRKKTVSNSDKMKEIQVYSSLHKSDYRGRYYEQIAAHCIHTIRDIHDSEKIPFSDFMILLRITKIPVLRNHITKYAEELEVPVSEKNEPGNFVRLMSVHRSKGLQAKYVFILNLDNDLYGFPCGLEDPCIFEPAIEKNDGLREEEERRLFYVAVTRAKEGVFMYSQKCAESKFITEIKGFVKKEELDYK